MKNLRLMLGLLASVAAVVIISVFGATSAGTRAYEPNLMASWVQAIGSIGAILAAIHVVQLQHRLTEESSQREQARQADMLGICIRAAARQAHQAFSLLEESCREHRPAKYAEARWGMLAAKQVLMSVDVRALPQRQLVSPILSLIALLDEGAERTLERPGTNGRGLYVLLSMSDAERMKCSADRLFHQLADLTQK